MKFCTNCGAQVLDGSKFCTECGQRIEARKDQYSCFHGTVLHDKTGRC